MSRDKIAEDDEQVVSEWTVSSPVVTSTVNARVAESSLCCWRRTCIQDVTQKWQWTPAWQCRKTWGLWQYVFSVGRPPLASLRMRSEIGNPVFLPHSHAGTSCTSENELQLFHKHHTRATSLSLSKSRKNWLQLNYTTFYLFLFFSESHREEDLRLRTLTVMGCFCWMVCV